MGNRDIKNLSRHLNSCLPLLGRLRDHSLDVLVPARPSIFVLIRALYLVLSSLSIIYIRFFASRFKELVSLVLKIDLRNGLASNSIQTQTKT